MSVRRPQEKIIRRLLNLCLGCWSQTQFIGKLRFGILSLSYFESNNETTTRGPITRGPQTLLYNRKFIWFGLLVHICCRLFVLFLGTPSHSWFYSLLLSAIWLTHFNTEQIEQTFNMLIDCIRTPDSVKSKLSTNPHVFSLRLWTALTCRSDSLLPFSGRVPMHSAAPFGGV